MKMKQGVSQLLVEWWFNHIFIQGMVLYILFISSVVSMLGFSLSEHINGISHLRLLLLFLTMLLLLFDSVDFTQVVMSYEDFITHYFIADLISPSNISQYINMKSTNSIIWHTTDLKEKRKRKNQSQFIV